MGLTIYIFGGVAICLMIYVAIQTMIVSSACTKKNGLWVYTPTTPFTRYTARSNESIGAVKDIEKDGKYYDSNKEVYASGYCILAN